MNQQDKEHLQRDLLNITGFSEVVRVYYDAIDATNWWHLLALSGQNGESYCEVGSHKLNISSLRHAMANQSVTGLSPSAANQLFYRIYISIKHASTRYLFQLMEKADEDEDRAPPSIKQLLLHLRTPESKQIIDKLCGNTENNLNSLEGQIEKLWTEHGQSAYVFRNHLVHGRMNLHDPDSRAWKDLIGNEQSSKDFYKTLNGMRDILNFISKSFFAARKDLPTHEEYAEAILEDKIEDCIWCFDQNKFPRKFDSSDLPASNVLPPE